MQQSTIAEKVSCTGIGLHTGVPVGLTLHPARANTGVVLIRKDAGDGIEIPARPGAVSSTSHATTLACDGVSIKTVEHLLAALHSMGIDNVRVEIDGPEVPVMDGSAESFVYLLHLAGTFRQREPRARLKVHRTVEVIDGSRRIRIEPGSGFEIAYAVDFEHPAIGRQEFHVPRLTPDFFEKEISRARTFGFLDEVNELLRAGLARGGSLENTVVLDEDRVVNPGGLRWPDEFVRHKVLDLIGDLSLLGLPIEGAVHVERGGHALHQRLVQAVLEAPEAVEILGDEVGFPHGFDLVGAVPEATLP